MVYSKIESHQKLLPQKLLFTSPSCGEVFLSLGLSPNFNISRKILVFATVELESLTIRLCDNAYCS